jgi:hypothetical protein
VTPEQEKHIEKDMRAFLVAHPKLKKTQANWDKLEDWLRKHGNLPVTTTNLSAAFEAVKDTLDFEPQETDEECIKHYVAAYKYVKDGQRLYFSIKRDPTDNELKLVNYQGKLVPIYRMLDEDTNDPLSFFQFEIRGVSTSAPDYIRRLEKCHWECKVLDNPPKPAPAAAPTPTPEPTEQPLRIVTDLAQLTEKEIMQARIDRQKTVRAASLQPANPRIQAMHQASEQAKDDHAREWLGSMGKSKDVAL